MDLYISELLHVVIGTSILLVWTLRFNKSSRYRIGHAQTLQEEFDVVGIPYRLYQLVRVMKPVSALLLVFSIIYKPFSVPCLIVLTLLMIGAVCSHMVMKDSFIKYVPSMLVLTLCTVALYYTCS